MSRQSNQGALACCLMTLIQYLIINCRKGSKLNISFHYGRNEKLQVSVFCISDYFLGSRRNQLYVFHKLAIFKLSQKNSRGGMKETRPWILNFYILHCMNKCRKQVFQKIQVFLVVFVTCNWIFGIFKCRYVLF